MIQLITISDIQALKPISSNVDTTKKLNTFILEAQQFDLKELMGNAFYLDFINDFSSSPSLPVYSSLWNGSEFTCGSKTYRHEGLKSVLIYLSYARYVLNSNTDATATGTVHKKEEYSEHVSDKTVQRLYDQAYSGALVYWEDVKRYLDSQEFELWSCKKTPQVRGKRIGGVSNERRYRP